MRKSVSSSVILSLGIPVAYEKARVIFSLSDASRHISSNWRSAFSTVKKSQSLAVVGSLRWASRISWIILSISSQKIWLKNSGSFIFVSSSILNDKSSSGWNLSANFFLITEKKVPILETYESAMRSTTISTSSKKRLKSLCKMISPRRRLLIFPLLNKSKTSSFRCRDVISTSECFLFSERPSK